MDVFEALADPSRRRIIELVAQRPRAAGEVAQHFTTSRPAISQHLNALVACGMLQVEPSGRRRVYSFNQESLAEPLNWLEAQRHRWNDALDRLEENLNKEGMA